MARLHEYQAKALLREQGMLTPEGGPAATPEEAEAIARGLGMPVVLKIQAWTTGRKAMGGVAFAETPAQAREQAARLLAMKVGRFPVEKVIVEQQIAIRDEIFFSLTIDDSARGPMVLLALEGGTGIEDRAASVHRIPVDVFDGIDLGKIRDLILASSIDAQFHEGLVAAIDAATRLARKVEARSLEINPLVTTRDGKVMAADCRMTIDDYAVFRHPELGITIARELDHPPTRLERIAYAVEQNDHRGTFYFAQLPVEHEQPVIGFHGAGGGGSMMSMDAITSAGFAIANFTDTSGNPSSAKVYRAARIILAQPGLVGYFGSGSGVASQEQFHSAYGLAKAFREVNLSIPAVIRLGGNSEDRAVEILQDACRGLPAPVEGYRKDDTPAFCAQRFRTLVEQSERRPGGGTVGRQGAGGADAEPHSQHLHRRMPAFVGSSDAYHFNIAGGKVWIDHAACERDPATSALVVAQSSWLLKPDQRGKPVLAVSEPEVANKDSELIALEIECIRAGRPVVFVDLPVPGLDDDDFEDA